MQEQHTPMQLISRCTTSHNNLQALAQRTGSLGSANALASFTAVCLSGQAEPGSSKQHAGSGPSQAGSSCTVSNGYATLLTVPYLQAMLPAAAGNAGASSSRRRNPKKTDSYDPDGSGRDGSGGPPAGSFLLAAFCIPVQHRRLVCYGLLGLILLAGLGASVAVMLAPRASVAHARCPPRQLRKPVDLSTLPRYKGAPGE